MMTRARKSYIAGLILAIVAIIILSLTSTSRFLSPGPANVGHEKLECVECHESAQGSIRQQAQANLKYFLGMRHNTVPFKYENPNNDDCIACHDRENDRHPVYRFNEPRFKEAREALSPQLCVSCHLEHTGVRANSKISDCKYCHEDTEMKNDPLDVSHKTIIERKNWDSCMACHDFHGSHIRETQTVLKNGIDKAMLKDYLAGGKDPYSTEKSTQAKETRYEN